MAPPPPISVSANVCVCVHTCACTCACTCKGLDAPEGKINVLVVVVVGFFKDTILFIISLYGWDYLCVH